MTQHIIEFRWRFISLFFSFFCTFCSIYIYCNEYIYLLTKPLNLFKFIFTDISEAFQTYIELSFVLSFFLLFPFILYQIFCFFVSGLFKHEQKYIFWLLKSFLFFYFLGFFLNWHIVLPILWFFFMQFEIHKGIIHIELEARILTNIEFILKTFFISQIFFQSPFWCILCIQNFDLKTSFLSKNRSLFYIIILLFCSFFCPPDFFIQLVSSQMSIDGRSGASRWGGGLRV